MAPTKVYSARDDEFDGNISVSWFVTRLVIVMAGVVLTLAPFVTNYAVH